MRKNHAVFRRTVFHEACPKLDLTFVPFGVWSEAYLKGAQHPIAIAVEREGGKVSVHHTFIHATGEMAEADYRYVERYVKFLLWSVGGFRVSVCGCPDIAAKLKAAYTPEGERHFDHEFVGQLYEREIEILDLPLESCPAANETAAPMGGHTDGCRIGFDAGGSDRKVSAVIDGECVFGCKYFSQDAVIKLAPAAGIELDPSLSPAEKLKVVQALMAEDDERAKAIYETIGAYLAYTVVLYSQFYDIEHMMMLGRVMSGKGGDIILDVCNAILKDEFPALAEKAEVMLPDEKTRRVGQSVAAATLPQLK